VEEQVKKFESQKEMCPGWPKNERDHPQERLEILQAVPAGYQKQLPLVRNWTAHEERNGKPRDTKEGEQPNWVKSNVLAGCP
jgi:hypothetical protein